MDIINAYKVLLEHLKYEDHLGDLWIDGRKQNTSYRNKVMGWTGFNWLKRTMVGLHEKGNEHSGSIRSRNILIK
jgi:hypothetical protein